METDAVDCGDGCQRRILAQRFFEERWREKGATVVARVEGHSMGDTLVAGTRVCIQYSRQSKFERNDIVCFRRGDRNVIHRILFCLGPICIEKGDGNPYPNLCRRRDIIGVFTGVEEEVGDGGGAPR